MNEIVKQHIAMRAVPISQLLDAIAQQGEQYIADGHEHSAQLFLLRREGDGYAVEVIAVAPLPAPDKHDEKDAIARALGELVAPFDAYIFLSECWMVTVKSRDEVKQHAGHVAEHPDRVEIFALDFVTRAGESRSLQYEIKRDQERPYFGPVCERQKSVGPVEGRFVNFYLWAREPGEQGN